ncbi:hypothetical protein C8F04DRAFT_1183159 [Mycena alexandri]|uniref:Uncharacterized protein n=1 Tax=Mycena alexandri TaxID=1745969 RepID=A0AAD6SVJ4_9AGAR|nr:hypothetical protein C8F04DRAFT_1183159 [Mycena alexandri]
MVWFILRGIAQRTVDLLERLADAIPDPTEISDHMLNNIARFESVLEEIQAEMSQLANRGLRWRLMYLNRNEDSLRKFNSLLDDASRGFLVWFLHYYTPASNNSQFSYFNSPTLVDGLERRGRRDRGKRNGEKSSANELTIHVDGFAETCTKISVS